MYLSLKSHRRSAHAAALGAICLLGGWNALLGGLALPLRAALMRWRCRVLAATAWAGRRRLLGRALLHRDAALQRPVLGICETQHSHQRCPTGVPPTHYVKTHEGCGSSCLYSCIGVHGRRALQLERLASLNHWGYLWISMDGSPLRSASPLWPPAAPLICSKHSDKRRDIARAVAGARRLSQCIWYHAYL